MGGSAKGAARMTPVSYYVPDEFTSPKFAYAFAKGCGGSITEDLDYLFDGPAAMFGSPPAWPVLRRAQEEGRDWFFGDHAYFGRGKYFRVTKNAYQHDGQSRGVLSDRYLRFKRPIFPWRKAGAYVLVCPQSDVYFSLHGIDAKAWLADVTDTLRQHTDRPIRVRWKASRTPIAPDLEAAWAVVVFSSAAALDALIAGVPIITLAPFAASVRMGATDLSQIESPIYPDDREPFLHALADNQWTLAEIMRGAAWRHLHEQGAIRAA
jgi:hypothetical protein